jgi:hypothetical protein
MRRDMAANALVLGFMVGLIFGSWDVVWTWSHPLEDDGPWMLLRFYGPMFLMWMVVSLRAARRTGHLWSGAVAGMAVAFGTFCVFAVLNLLRVNLFLEQLTARSDWQNMMGRFRASASESLRLFVTFDYLEGMPFKIGVATVLGGAIGSLAGVVGAACGHKSLGPARR